MASTSFTIGIFALTLSCQGLFSGLDGVKTTSTRRRSGNASAQLFTDTQSVFSRNQCYGCHSTWQGYSESEFLAEGLVISGEPQESPLYRSLKGAGFDESMPPSGRDLSPQDLSTIESWILAMAESSSPSDSNDPNLAPRANAGDDAGVLVGTAYPLAASAEDDGYPRGVTLQVQWRQVSGPGTATFSAPDRLDSTVSFATAGAYVLSLTVSDSDLSTTDTVTLTATNNTPPVVNAGANRAVATTTFTLMGTASDSDGPNALTLTWNRVSGPGNVTFTAANQLSTSVTVSAAGTHRFRLSANDGSTTTTSNVDITIDNPATRYAAAQQILINQCITCHATRGPRFQSTFTEQDYVNAGLISRSRNPQNSRIWREMNGGMNRYLSTNPQTKAQQLETIRLWLTQIPQQ